MTLPHTKKNSRPQTRGELGKVHKKLQPKKALVEHGAKKKEGVNNIKVPDKEVGSAWSTTSDLDSVFTSHLALALSLSPSKSQFPPL